MQASHLNNKLLAGLMQRSMGSLFRNGKRRNGAFESCHEYRDDKHLESVFVLRLLQLVLNVYINVSWFNTWFMKVTDTFYSCKLCQALLLWLVKIIWGFELSQWTHAVFSEVCGHCKTLCSCLTCGLTRCDLIYGDSLIWISPESLYF